MSDSGEGGPSRSRSSSTGSNSSRGEQSPSSSMCLPQTLTQADIHQILLENQKILQAIYQNQNLGKFSDSVSYLEILQRNILHLGRVADMPGFVGDDRNEWPPDITHRWARDEFDRLRIAINVYGTGNLELISRFVATKSVDEVVKMMPLFLPPPVPQDPNFARSSLPLPPHGVGPSRDHTYTAPTMGLPSQHPSQTFTTRMNVSLADAPATTGTVTMSQLASMRTSGPSPTNDANMFRTPVHQGILPQASNMLNPPGYTSSYGPSPSLYNGMPNDLTTMGGTMQFGVNPGSLSGPATMAPSSSMTLITPMHNAPPLRQPMNEPSTTMNAQQAPNGVGTFGSFSTHTTSSSAPSMTLVTFPGMETPHTPAAGPTQPAISISMYDVSGSSVSHSNYGSSHNNSSFVAKSTGGYIPAPGQVLVNMDKTTLFTPSNPPRPGSPRSPRTPKSPKSPKSPASTAPHSPKSPKPEPT